jgi:hypothetical protein
MRIHSEYHVRVCVHVTLLYLTGYRHIYYKQLTMHQLAMRYKACQELLQAHCELRQLLQEYCLFERGR